MPVVCVVCGSVNRPELGRNKPKANMLTTRIANCVPGILKLKFNLNQSVDRLYYYKFMIQMISDQIPEVANTTQLSIHYFKYLVVRFPALSQSVSHVTYLHIHQTSAPKGRECQAVMSYDLDLIKYSHKFSTNLPDTILILCKRERLLAYTH